MKKKKLDKWNRPAVSFETNSLKEGSRKSENSQNPPLEKKQNEQKDETKIYLRSVKRGKVLLIVAKQR